MLTENDTPTFLLRQWRFPIEFTAEDTLWQVAHETLFALYGFAHWRACKARYYVPIEWIAWMRRADPKIVIAFLGEWTKKQCCWTGFRLLGAIKDRAPTYTVQLFLNHSNATVYSRVPPLFDNDTDLDGRRL